jgi:MoxR-like ATPase
MAEATKKQAAQAANAAGNPDDVAAVAKWEQTYHALCAEMGKVIVGQAGVLEQMVVAILAQGHCLLEGVPGLAKTLMIQTSSSPRT